MQTEICFGLRTDRIMNLCGGAAKGQRAKMAELFGCNDEINQFSSEDEESDWGEMEEKKDATEQIFTKEIYGSVTSMPAESINGEHFSDDCTKAEGLGNGKSSEAKTVSSKKPIHRMALNDHKAGMEGLDKEKINQIIFEASKGSKYYENEKKKEKRVKEKIKSFKDLMKTFSEADYQIAKREVNSFVKKVKCERDFSRIIVHIDMDAFYAAVETRDNPSLKDIPMAVGSNSMLCTSNYAARKFGVRAAMPGFIAKKLCPNLTIIPTNFAKYREISAQVRQIIGEYDPNFCGVGLDEAYLDLTDYMNDIFESIKVSNIKDMKLHKQNLVERTVAELREKIFLKTQLTASAGIASNIMLAKVCSDMNKPNGQYYLQPQKDIIHTFLHDLPIRKVSGIGRVSEQILNELGINKCGHLYEKKELLYLLFSEISFQHFLRISLGISSTMLDHESERKSMSAETTFQEISEPEKLFQICKDLCEGLANDLQKENLAGKSVTVKFKFVNFEVKTRTRTIQEYINASKEIFSVAKEIIQSQINACRPGKLKLRLLGVRVSELGEKGKASQNRLDGFLSKTKQRAASKDSYTPENQIVDSLVSKKNISDCSSGLEDSETSFACPICQVLQKSSQINLHIDSCLNKQAIKEILSKDSKIFSKEEDRVKNKKRKATSDMTGSSSSSKKTTLTSFWGGR